MNNYLKVFIKEIIPIVLGILIAMYINNWNEERKDKKYINQISSSINQELIETNKEIKRIMPLQKAFIDTLRIYSKDNKVTLIDIVFKNHGIKTPAIKINSWKAISNSRIELMEYNKISTLANIEEKKDFLKISIGKLVDFMFSNATETGINEKKLMAILFQDVINAEVSIQEDIDKIINHKNN